MQRVDAPEILDSDNCSANDVAVSMRDMGRINRWFGGVATTRKMVERVSGDLALKRMSMLEVAAGAGEVPELVRQGVARRGITLEVTLLDRSRSHLPRTNNTVVGDALSLPFGDEAFDLVSCNLFAHHLNTEQLAQFIREGLRVSRSALLINDLVRNPVHLALAYTSRAVIRSRIAWLDGITSVRRAYTPEEIRSILSSALPAGTPALAEISRAYLFRMGVIVWKIAPRPMSA